MMGPLEAFELGVAVGVWLAYGVMRFAVWRNG